MSSKKNQFEMDMDDLTDDNYDEDEEEDEEENEEVYDDDEMIDDVDFGLSELGKEKASNDKNAKGSNSARAYADIEFKYEVLKPDEIVKHMVECIKEVNQVVQLTRILLHHFRWDKEKLMERFYDSDQERLFKEAHVVSPFKSMSGNTMMRSLSSQQSTSSSSSQRNNKDIVCEICYETSKDGSNMSGLECGHMFCKMCWRDYLTTKIMDEGIGQVDD